MTGTRHRFVLFSFGRTGSSTLARVIGRVRRVAFEPFGTGERERIPGRFERPIAYMDHVLTLFDGVKHVQGFLSFAQEQELLEHLLLCDTRIVFLWRRNALQRRVSDMIAAQTRLWGPKYLYTRQQLDQPLEPLPIPEIQKRLAMYWRRTGTYKSILESVGRDYRELVYEDLYQKDGEVDKLNDLVRLMAWLGIQADEIMPHLDQIRAELHPGLTKLGGREQYQRVPNLAEIMREYGVDESLEPLPGHDPLVYRTSLAQERSSEVAT